MQIVGVSRLAVTKPTAAASPKFSKAFHKYLVNRAEMQTAKLQELGSANQGLTDDNNFLKQGYK
jgi:hypothetical protein